MLLSRDVVVDTLLGVGFDLCGVVKAQYSPIVEERFSQWLTDGNGDSLGYLHRNMDKRFDPSSLMDGGRSVVVCGVNYKHLECDSGVSNGVGIAMYATMRDYHKTIKKMLKEALKLIQERYPECTISGRCFVDSAPLSEKSLAVEAGFGWVGRQSLVVTPQYGSRVLLGEILLDVEFDHYDHAEGEDRCGRCRRCIDSCPVGAINENRTIDANRCIACRTIEMDDSGEESLHGWIFGCDVCQTCCPHNHSTPLYTNGHMRPIVERPTAEQWLVMSQKEFDTLTAGTPLRRSSLERLQRNVLKNY